jgi:phosphoribosylformimino-5-aminoimidazole carboxamide ribotide isomerase
MDIIPVIDLLNGVVVHAREGRRESYRPLSSSLCEGAKPEAVVAGLLRLHPFRTFYAADLDSLMGRPPQTETLARLRAAFSDLEFWIDRGLPEKAAGLSEPPVPGTVPVVGSESLTEEHLTRPAGFAAEFVLSLDFREGRLDGPGRLLAEPGWWPERVILMNLGRVGGSEGPDFRQAERFRQNHSRHRLVAAGGVRDAADLARLEDSGMAAVLLASALHSGAVDGRALERFG